MQNIYIIIIDFKNYVNILLMNILHHQQQRQTYLLPWVWIQILSSQTSGKLDLEDLQTPHILQGSSVAKARDI